MSTDERRAIEARAERAGMSVSGYMRVAALGRAIRTRGMSDATDALCDLEAVLSALAVSLRDAAGAVGRPERMAAELGELDAARDRLVRVAGTL